jgi:peptidoglycan hydrolase-like protein with peptidoglycan-binding domain
LQFGTQPDTPAGTILESFSWWAGAGDSYYLVRTGNGLSLRHRSLDESGNGQVEELKAIPVAATTTVKTGAAVDLPVPALNRALSFRSPLLTGDDVDYLQFLLKVEGYREVGVVDGVFGQKTRAAVIRFQKANGLGADGVVGPKTWSKLTDPEVKTGE